MSVWLSIKISRMIKRPLWVYLPKCFNSLRNYIFLSILSQVGRLFKTTKSICRKSLAWCKRSFWKTFFCNALTLLLVDHQPSYHNMMQTRKLKKGEIEVKEKIVSFRPSWIIPPKKLKNFQHFVWEFLNPLQ
jgi:hypothetical protein